MIKVVIAEDHHLVRQGIRALLEQDPDIEVIGEAGDGQEAIHLVERLAPDVLVMDISMPRLNGIQAVERVSALGLDTQVLMLTMHTDEVLIRQALHKGARGFLDKGSFAEELLLAVRAASRGATYFSPPISKAVLNGALMGGMQGEMLHPMESLTSREREVLQLISEGYTNQSMAEAMNISVKTVERHRTHLMGKLKAKNLVSLIRTAIKYGLIELDE